MHHLRGSTQELRRRNRSRVLRRLLALGEATRARLAEDTGLTLMAISRITRELLDAGLVADVKAQGATARRGRRSGALRLAPGGGYVIGVSASAYEHVVALADITGQVISHVAIPAHEVQDSTAFLDDTVQQARAMLSRAGVPPERLFGVGAAVAGMVAHEEGRVLRAPYIGWREVNVADHLCAALGCPVAVESLDHAVNLGEVRFGLCIGCRDVLMARVATGIGGSLFVEGSLAHGTRSSAGQIGHMRVIQDGPLCTCGRSGCLNTVASGWAVLHELGQAAVPASSPEDIDDNARKLAAVMARAEQGEALAEGALFRAGERLGDALVNLSIPLAPEVVLLAGPLPKNEAYWKGIVAGWTAAGGARVGDVPLLLSRMEGFTAAMYLALWEFVFTPRLDIEPLIARGEAADGAVPAAGAPEAPA